MLHAAAKIATAICLKLQQQFVKIYFFIKSASVDALSLLLSSSKCDVVSVADYTKLFRPLFTSYPNGQWAAKLNLDVAKAY